MTNKLPPDKDPTIHVTKSDSALINEFFMPRARAHGFAKATLKEMRNLLLRAARVQASRGRTLRGLRGRDIPPILRCVPASVIRNMRASLHCLLKFQGRQIADHKKRPWQDCADEHFRFMSEQCGFSPGTRRVYSDAARHFLDWQFGSGPVRWREVRRHDVLRYARIRIRGISPRTAQLRLITLRGFLRWAHLSGRCSSLLAHAVPMVACFRMSTSPSILTDRQRVRLLSSFARDAQGRCEHAMAVCMIDLGMRVSEVCLLRVDDIDWRERTVRVPAVKGGLARVIPLPSQVLETLRNYIMRVRPEADCQVLFLRSVKLIGKPVSVPVIKMAMRRAYRRSRFPERWTGTHILRRTFATRLIRRGASMREVGDLLGHKGTAVTGCYTAVDLRDLHCVTQPWPR